MTRTRVGNPPWLLLLVSILSACTTTRSGERAALDAYLATEFVADGPGGVVLVARGEDVLVHAAFGLADVENARAMRLDDRLAVGSVTKSFAAAAILRLAEAQQLSLHGDVRDYVPHVPTGGHSVTVEQLLTHTSGMPNLVDRDDFMEWAMEERSTDELVHAIDGMEWLAPPGEEFHYSDSGYIVLGAVVEELSGGSFAEFVRRELAGPLAMHATDSATRRRESDPVGTSDGRSIEGLHMSVPHAAGQLMSSVEDLWRWVRAWRDGVVVSAEVTAEAWSGRDLGSGRRSGYGYGWKRSELAGRPAVGHGGWVPGFTATMLHLPEDDLTAIVLANSDDGRPEAGYVARRCLRLLLTGSPHVVAVAVDEGRRAQLVGGYVTPGGSRLAVTDRGGVMWVRWDAFEIELEALTTSRFAAADSDGTWCFTFTDERDGVPTALEVSLSGEPQERAVRAD